MQQFYKKALLAFVLIVLADALLAVVLVERSYLSLPLLLAKSKAMRWGQAAQTLTLDVSGAKVIELVARSTGGDNAMLPVTWGEAALLGTGKSD